MNAGKGEEGADREKERKRERDEGGRKKTSFYNLYNIEDSDMHANTCTEKERDSNHPVQFQSIKDI